MVKGDFDYLTGGIREVDKLNHMVIVVGVLLPTGNRSLSYNQMIAETQENGATIKPKTTQYLTIPTPYADNKKATEIKGLFYHQTKSGLPSLAKRENGDLHVYYMLKKEVNIPARPFMKHTLQRYTNTVVKMLIKGINECYLNRETAQGVANKIGKFLTREMKRTLVEWKDPENAGITSANKGKNDPLMNTGALKNSISWRVVYK